MLLPKYLLSPHIRLLLKSVIYRSLLLWEKVPRNEADEEGEKGRCAMEKFVYVTDTSSTASGPPSPTGEGFCKPSISATDKGLVCERSDLGSSGRRPLQVLRCFYCFVNIRLCDGNLSRAFSFGEGGSTEHFMRWSRRMRFFIIWFFHLIRLVPRHLLQGRRLFCFFAPKT